MAKPRLGSGGRFAALRRAGKSAALVAYIGRNKYGNAEMSKLAAVGRKRKSKH